MSFLFSQNEYWYFITKIIKYFPQLSWTLEFYLFIFFLLVQHSCDVGLNLPPLTWDEKSCKIARLSWLWQLNIEVIPVQQLLERGIEPPTSKKKYCINSLLNETQFNKLIVKIWYNSNICLYKIFLWSFMGYGRHS